MCKYTAILNQQPDILKKTMKYPHVFKKRRPVLSLKSASYFYGSFTLLKGSRL